MTILTSEEVKQYEGLRAADIKRGNGMSDAQINRLQAAEKRLHDTGVEYGLPYWFVLQHHMNGVGSTVFAREIGLSNKDIFQLSAHFQIPTATLSEANVRIWKNDRHRGNRTQGVKESWKRPDVKRNHSEGRKKTWDKKKREHFSEMMLERWRNPEYRKEREKWWADQENMGKYSDAKKAEWASPEYRRRRGAALITVDDHYVILSSYDRVSVKVDTYNEVIRGIWSETGIRKADIRRLLRRYFTSE